MKLVLASQGFTTDKIAKSVENLVGKSLNKVNIAIINEAYVGLDGTIDKRWLIKELSNIEKYIGGIIDFINFRAYTKEDIINRLNMSDLIYIVGGKITSKKLWKERYPQDKEVAETHEELNLVDFNIIPHYMREDHKKWQQVIAKLPWGHNLLLIEKIKDKEIRKIYVDAT